MHLRLLAESVHRLVPTIYEIFVVTCFRWHRAVFLQQQAADRAGAGSIDYNAVLPVFSAGTH